MAKVNEIVEQVEQIAKEFGAQVVRQSSILGGYEQDEAATELCLFFDEDRDFRKKGTKALWERAKAAGRALVDALDETAWKVTHRKVRGYFVFGVYNDYAGGGSHLLAYRSKIRIEARG